MKVVFACAGTGGHINPAIAIANMILKRQKDASILFIGREKGLENDLVSKAGFDIKHVRTGRINRSFTLENFKSMMKNYQGIKDAKNILKEFQADLVIGTGGYICVPVMLACQKLKIPYILHESNALPGMSVKLLAKKAAKVFVGFEEAKTKLGLPNVIYTGTPAKFDEDTILRLKKENCKKELGFSHIHKKIVLVTCGSQGAKNVNTKVLQMVANYLSDEFFVILLAGTMYYDEMIALQKELEKEKQIDLKEYIQVEKFVYEMEKMYKVADFAITRAGAMTISELSIARLPAILIPFPNAAENHQLYNAKVLENVNAGYIIEEKDLTVEGLYGKLIEMLKEDTLKAMAKNAITINSFEIEESIYQNIMDVVKK